MSWVAGIDYSTHAIDVVLVDENDELAPLWERFELEGANAFDRARSVRDCVTGLSTFSENLLAVGIEDPRGYNAGALYRVQGALLCKFHRSTLVHPLVPSQWRKLVGLPGNATKQDVAAWALRQRDARAWKPGTPQDAFDAYCIAVATRTLIQQGQAA